MVDKNTINKKQEIKGDESKSTENSPRIIQPNTTLSLRRFSGHYSV